MLHFCLFQSLQLINQFHQHFSTFYTTEPTIIMELTSIYWLYITGIEEGSQLRGRANWPTRNMSTAKNNSYGGLLWWGGLQPPSPAFCKLPYSGLFSRGKFFMNRPTQAFWGGNFYELSRVLIVISAFSKHFKGKVFTNGNYWFVKFVKNFPLEKTCCMVCYISINSYHNIPLGTCKEY